VIHNVIHAQIHQISHARVVFQTVHILIIIKIRKLVHYNVLMVIIKLITIVCNVIKLV
jgi:hypothetical protein